MSDLSRRAFLVRGSLGIAAVGAMSAMPGLTGALTTAETEAPAVEDAATTAVPEGGASAISMDQPLVAHIKDLQTGEMSLFMGEREVIYKDPLLAAKLLSAAR